MANAIFQNMQKQGMLSGLPTIDYGFATFKLSGPFTLDNLHFCHLVQDGEVSNKFCIQYLISIYPYHSFISLPTHLFIMGWLISTSRKTTLKV